MEEKLEIDYKVSIKRHKQAASIDAFDFLFRLTCGKIRSSSTRYKNDLHLFIQITQSTTDMEKDGSFLLPFESKLNKKNSRVTVQLEWSKCAET